MVSPNVMENESDAARCNECFTQQQAECPPPAVIGAGKYIHPKEECQAKQGQEDQEIRDGHGLGSFGVMPCWHGAIIPRTFSGMQALRRIFLMLNWRRLGRRTIGQAYYLL